MAGPVHIIAEAGTNHGGRLERALALADIARAAGADSVKFQIIYPEGLYLPRFYHNGEANGYVDNEVFRARAAGMLADDDYRALAEHCRCHGLPLSASVFDRRSLDLLCALDPPYIKIASCDLNNTPLLKMAAERGRKLIVSTGMASLGEVEQAVNDILATGNRDLVLMHCVSVYPAPLERMNLDFLRVLRAAFGLPVGLSDHTESSLAGAMAVALGAEWVEKHFTYDRKAAGFDHAYAMEPDGLAQYVANIRAAEEACRRPALKVGDDERQVRQRARRALYAARAIAAGERLAEADVLVVRPEGPLTPQDLPRVLGRTARRQIHQYEPLCPEQLE
jgi:sialic acid synthase SpsE